MNELNYCTLLAAQRLHEAGIEIKAGVVWYEIQMPGSLEKKWVLSHRSGNEPFYGNSYPAPSMAEVWRELPDTFNNRPICVSKTSNQWTHAEILGGGPSFLRLNPTDALIDFLIWVRKEWG